MTMSVLEANVPPGKWDEMKLSFQKFAQTLPPQISMMSLIQSIDNPQHWKIVIMWHEKKEQNKLTEIIKKCEGANIFKTIGIEPEQGLYKVVLSARELDLGSDLAETPISDMLAPVEDGS